jgi:hypothetical protein
VASAGPVVLRNALEGDYVKLTNLRAAPTALALASVPAGATVAVLLPLDDLFNDRVETARRLWRALVGGADARAAGPSVGKRRRLKLMLRAVDADLGAAAYRTVARGLFGSRIPSDAAWRTHSLRGQVIRLVRDGRALMIRGYLSLLRPDHRRR